MQFLRFRCLLHLDQPHTGLKYRRWALRMPRKHENCVNSIFRWGVVFDLLPYWFETPEMSCGGVERASKLSENHILIEGVRSAPILAWNTGNPELYYTILYYTILYYTILYYTILYYTILYCNTLYYTIICYNILYYTILYYNILYYTILDETRLD